MNTPKIIIEISGGNIVRTITNIDMDIVIVDRDNIEAGSVEEIHLTTPELVLENPSEYYEEEPVICNKINELFS